MNNMTVVISLKEIRHENLKPCLTRGLLIYDFVFSSYENECDKLIW